MITSAEEFARLRVSDDPREQRRAATEEASEDTWRKVIQELPALRKWVAVNKTVPLSILAVLAADPDPRVRSAVAQKRKLGAGLFEQLAGDPDAAVRHRVACNPKCPTAVLAQLARDPERFVRGAAGERLGGRT